MPAEKVYLVTGSTAGIGREIARILLNAGNKVVIHGRKPRPSSEIESIFAGLNGEYRYVPGDVSDPAECESLVAAVIGLFGKLDGLILNAGITSVGTLHDQRPEVTKNVITTNLNSAFYILHYAIPHLISTKGAVIFISSVAGLHGLPGYAPYSASKMALISVFESLRAELCDTGVFVAIVLPGFTEHDPDKRRYSAEGNSEIISPRHRVRFAPQTTTAQKIVQQLLYRKKPFVVHSRLGIFAWWMTRLFPRLSDRIIVRIWRKGLI